MTHVVQSLTVTHRSSENRIPGGAPVARDPRPPFHFPIFVRINKPPSSIVRPPTAVNECALRAPRCHDPARMHYPGIAVAARRTLPLQQAMRALSVQTLDTRIGRVFRVTLRESSEHPSQGVGSYAYRLAGLTHLAQIGCAGRQQAFISVNATTANRLHPKQPPHDLGLRLHSYDTPAGSGSGSFPNHPPFAHRPTFHKYTATRRKMHVRTRRSRPHPQPLSRLERERGVEEANRGLHHCAPASARETLVPIPNVLGARRPPGDRVW
jgi:hypothetical protein